MILFELKRLPFSIKFIFDVLSCMSIWLSLHKDHVVIVGCTNGKAKTGPVVACYLRLIHQFNNTNDAFEYFVTKRSPDNRNWITVVQKRYLRYFESIMNHQGMLKNNVPLCLNQLIICSLPNIENEDHENNSEVGCHPIVEIFSADEMIYNSSMIQYEMMMSSTPTDALNSNFESINSEKSNHLETDFVDTTKDYTINDGHTLIMGFVSKPIVLLKDIQIKISHQSNKRNALMPICSYTFNTGFVSEGSKRLILKDLEVRQQLLSNEKDDRFSDDFAIDLVFLQIQAKPTPIPISLTTTTQSKHYAAQQIFDEKFLLQRETQKGSHQSLQIPSNSNRMNNVWDIDVDEQDVRLRLCKVILHTIPKLGTGSKSEFNPVLQVTQGNQIIYNSQDILSESNTNKSNTLQNSLYKDDYNVIFFIQKKVLIDHQVAIRILDFQSKLNESNQFKTIIKYSFNTELMAAGLIRLQASNLEFPDISASDWSKIFEVDLALDILFAEAEDEESTTNNTQNRAMNQESTYSPKLNSHFLSETNNIQDIESDISAFQNVFPDQAYSKLFNIKEVGYQDYFSMTIFEHLTILSQHHLVQPDDNLCQILQEQFDRPKALLKLALQIGNNKIHDAHEFLSTRICREFKDLLEVASSNEAKNFVQAITELNKYGHHQNRISTSSSRSSSALTNDIVEEGSDLISLPASRLAHSTSPSLNQTSNLPKISAPVLSPTKSESSIIQENISTTNPIFASGGPPPPPPPPPPNGPGPPPPPPPPGSGPNLRRAPLKDRKFMRQTLMWQEVPREALSSERQSIWVEEDNESNELDLNVAKFEG